MQQDDPPADFLTILQTLSGHNVKFIVIGGVCAVLHGAPVTTFDLDIVHARTPDNLEHLMDALRDLDAYYREHRNTRLRPDIRDLVSAGHHLLLTQAGPLDLLGTVASGRDYDALLDHSTLLPIGDNLDIHVLDLATLIQLKEETGRDKDIAVLGILRHTLEEKNAQKKS